MAEPVQTFSPSQTDAYSFCPRYWWFYRNRFRVRYIAYPEIAAIIGTATAAGLEAFYKARQAGQTLDPIVVDTVAHGVAHAECKASLAGGLRYVTTKDQGEWEAIESNVSLLLKTHLKADPFKDYEVLAVEDTSDFHDRSDLILRDEHGLLIVDFKTRLKLTTEWDRLKKEQQKWARSWQLHHYAITRGATRFAAALITPRIRPGVVYEIVQVNHDYAKMWLKDAVQLWGEMAEHKDCSLYDLRGNTSHANEYGECLYWGEACSHGLDTDLMQANLVQIERVT